MAAIEVEGFRVADERECYSMCGDTAALQCYKALDTPDADTFTIMANDYPVGMFGVVPKIDLESVPGQGIVWFLASNGLYDVKRSFIKQCPVWLTHLQRYYHHVENFVHMDNTVGLKWVEYLGFTLEGVVNHGILGERFMHVTKTQL